MKNREEFFNRVDDPFSKKSFATTSCTMKAANFSKSITGACNVPEMAAQSKRSNNL